MSAKSAEILKNYFKTGAIPTEAQFGDLIDSIPNLIGGGCKLHAWLCNYYS